MRKTIVLSLILIFLTGSSLMGTAHVLASSVAENAWVTKESMPQVDSVRSAVVNEKIYVIGKETNYEYDPVLDTWTAKTPMPTARDSFGLAVYQNKIYVIGGRLWDPVNEVNLPIDANEVYDPLTDTWETREPMPTGRLGLNANVVDDRIYLLGGRTGDMNTTVALNEVYDPVADSWVAKEPMLYPVVGFASAVVNGKIHVIGGQNEFHDALNIDFNQIYDPVSDSWSLGAPLPTVVLNAAAGATTGMLAPKRIYVIGGTLGGGLMGTDIVQVYNPEIDDWSFGSSMPTARAWLSVAVVNDLLYAIGGSPGLMLSFLTTNEMYMPIGYGTPDPSLPSPPPNASTAPSPTQPPQLEDAFPILLVLFGVAILFGALSVVVLVSLASLEDGIKQGVKHEKTVCTAACSHLLNSVMPNCF
jgi:N-acetylneuraminic acid mutarotase